VTRFYDILAPLLGISNAVALFLLVVFLLLGPTRKFWVVLFYVSWELFATAGLTVADLHLKGTVQLGQATDAGKLYAKLYWTNDVIVDLLRFVLVVVLIYKVVGTSKPAMVRLLSGLVLAMIVLPFILFHPIFPSPRTLTAELFPRGAWFNSTSQLLNFGAAIMNVILWGALIQSKKRDAQTLAVSVGLGILVTGTAVSYGLRHFFPQGSSTAAFNLFLNLTQLAAWVIWCRAFWPAPRRKITGIGVRSQ
jgi:hypothetical protein